MSPPDPSDSTVRAVGSAGSEQTWAVEGRLDQVRRISFEAHRDGRGMLVAVESGADVPFEIRRVYYMRDLRGERGGHAHRTTHQVLIAVSGCAELVLSDGSRETVCDLSEPDVGLLIVPMLFIRVRAFTPDTVLLVFASTRYDPANTIRSWEAYLDAVGAR